MESFWTIGVIVLALVEVFTLVLILAFARELGTLLVRLGPTGALPAYQGPDIGQRLESHLVRDVLGVQHQLLDEPRMTLLLFVSTTCPFCKEILPAIRTMVGDYRDLSVRVLSSATYTEADDAYVRELDKANVPYVPDSSELQKSLRVGAVPYAILIGEDGLVRAKGIANNLQELESLVYTEVLLETRQSERRNVLVDEANAIGLAAPR